MASKKGKLSIEDSLVIDNVNQFKSKFERSLSSSNTLVIESSEIKQIDLTGIQLLYYMVNRAKTEKKDLEFKLKIEPEQKQLLMQNGFTKIIQTVF